MLDYMVPVACCPAASSGLVTCLNCIVWCGPAMLSGRRSPAFVANWSILESSLMCTAGTTVAEVDSVLTTVEVAELLQQVSTAEPFVYYFAWAICNSDTLLCPPQNVCYSITSSTLPGQEGTELAQLPEAPLQPLAGVPQDGHLRGCPGGAGGYLEHVFR